MNSCNALMPGQGSAGNELEDALMRTGAFDRGHQVGTWRTFDRKGIVVKETYFGD